MRISVWSRGVRAAGSRWLRGEADGWSSEVVVWAAAGVPVLPIVRLAEVMRTAGLLAVIGPAVGAVVALALRAGATGSGKTVTMG